MVGWATGVFRFVLLTPQGKLLDCRAGSVVVPGHDGQLGVLRNHAPLLCKLGLGLVRVEQIVGRENACFVVNGGFARVSENHMAVLAYDVTTFEDMEPHEIQALLAQARDTIAAGSKGQADPAEVQKARLILRMARYAGVEHVPVGDEPAHA
jgi:F-type H+-transporting ATPase subunit epsilon